jgi:carbon monoxide dehydrogenase subunit G
MEVKLDKRYPLEVDADRAWQVLRSVNSVAGCMPGAAITEQIDDTHYKGTVKVKVGPTTAAFAGDIEVRALDEAARRVVLFGKGADRGGSSASMELTATVEAVAGDPSKCDLVGQADVIVNGKFAQFGGRMMVQVSDMILAQFADNFRATAAALPAPAAAPAPTAAPTAAATGEGTAPVAAAEASTALAAAAATTPAPSAPPKLNKDLNAFAIVWMLIKNWFAGLFRKRPA